MEDRKECVGEMKDKNKRDLKKEYRIDRVKEIERERDTVRKTERRKEREIEREKMTRERQSVKQRL